MTSDAEISWLITVSVFIIGGFVGFLISLSIDSIGYIETDPVWSVIIGGFLFVSLIYTIIHERYAPIPVWLILVWGYLIVGGFIGVQISYYMDSIRFLEADPESGLIIGGLLFISMIYVVRKSGSFIPVPLFIIFFGLIGWFVYYNAGPPEYSISPSEEMHSTDFWQEFVLTSLIAIAVLSGLLGASSD